MSVKTSANSCPQALPMTSATASTCSGSRTSSRQTSADAFEYRQWQPQLQPLPQSPTNATSRGDTSSLAFSSPSPARPDASECGLGDAIRIGDVLNVRGTGGLMELGTAGGLFGHVLLVIGPAFRIDANSEEGLYLESVWPEGGVKEIWKVKTLESARSRSGLYEGDLYLYCERKHRKIVLLGEFSDAQFDISREPIELWQCPDELRHHLTLDIMRGTKNEMIAECASWSWTTAARAVLRPGELEMGSVGQASTRAEKKKILKDIQSCWTADPICTSVVIQFWQRCVCRIAEREGLEKADLIVRWFPLYCDRSLPGVLLRTMKECGWEKKERISTKKSGPSSRPTILSLEQVEQPPINRADLSRLGPVEAARYCQMHGTTDKRIKCEPRLRQCQNCNRQVQTNYADFTLCPPCSEKTDKCVLCGCAAKEEARAFVSLAAHPHCPQGPPPAASPEERQRGNTPVRGAGSDAWRTGPVAAERVPVNSPTKALVFGGCGLDTSMVDGPPGMRGSVLFPADAAGPSQGGTGQPPAGSGGLNGSARFCSKHCDRERRQKTVHPQTRECQSCRTVVQTNHQSFTLCPPCSEMEDRCMCCGDRAQDNMGDQTSALPWEASTNFQQVPAPFLPAGALANHRDAPMPFPQNASPWGPAGSPMGREISFPQEQQQQQPHLKQQQQHQQPHQQQHQQQMQQAQFSQHVEVVSGTVAGNLLAAAKYCSFHCSGNRQKGEPRDRECKACHTMITTNYVDCSLCPECSHGQNRCLICGGASQEVTQVPTPMHQRNSQDVTPMNHGGQRASQDLTPMHHGGQRASQDLTPMHHGGQRASQDVTPMPHGSTNFGVGGKMEPRFFAQASSGMHGAAAGASVAFASLHHPGASPMGGGEVQHGFGPGGAEQQGYQSQLPPQVPPRFCCMHDESIKRVKAAPRDRQCGECGLAVQTNYQEFTLCAWCSDKHDRCMLCGTTASNVGNAGPCVKNPTGADAVGAGWLAAQRLR